MGAQLCQATPLPHEVGCKAPSRGLEGQKLSAAPSPGTLDPPKAEGSISDGTRNWLGSLVGKTALSPQCPPATQLRLVRSIRPQVCTHT